MRGGWADGALCVGCNRGNQYVHIKVELPKSPLTDRQKELLAEFEAIEEEKKVNEKSKVASTIEKAWERIKKFMGTDSEKAGADASTKN